jgi:hypothetical protein
MRRMIESALVSADGVIGEPHLWTGNSFREKAGAYALVIPSTRPSARFSVGTEWRRRSLSQGRAENLGCLCRTDESWQPSGS